jgi:hypothetical protein
MDFEIDMARKDAEAFQRNAYSDIYAFNKLLRKYPDLHHNTIAGIVTDAYAGHPAEGLKNARS